MDYGIFNVRTDVNACDCTRGCTDTVRDSALKADWEKNPLPHRGMEPVPAASRSDALQIKLPPPPPKVIMHNMFYLTDVYQYALTD